MNNFKKRLSVLLALILMLSVFSGFGTKAVPAFADAAPSETQAVSDSYYHLGDKIDDFTVTTYDGKEVSLYKLLEEKDMVLLNLWATFCGPCASEFPAMQEAYEQYQDKVEIIALSTDPTDSDEILAEYVQEKGMTFCVTRDTADLAQRFRVSGIPTTIVVDRFGVICAISSGAEPEVSVFTNLFDIFTAEDYTESTFMPRLSSRLPDAKPVDPALLNEALNVEGGELVFANPSGRFYWPMIVEEKDGRTVAVASNVNASASLAVVETQIDAKAGDVLVMEYKLESEANISIMRITVDKEDVKVTSLSGDWATALYQFEEDGVHQVSVSFERQIDEGGEGLWIDSISLVTGDDAAQLMAEKPQYPVSEEFSMELLNENVEIAAIVLEETGELLLPVDLCTDPEIRIAVELPETLDPESAYLMDAAGNIYPLTAFVNGDGYLVEFPTLDPSENSSSGVVLYINGAMYAYIDIYVTLEQVDADAKLLADYVGLPLKAVLWDDSIVMAEEPAGDGIYTIIYVDQNGDPVPGVMCQVCDEATCQVFVSDANGVCEFTLPAGAYEIHTLKVPEGYEGDTTTVTDAPIQGGELTFTLTKK